MLLELALVLALVLLLLMVVLLVLWLLLFAVVADAAAVVGGWYQSLCVCLFLYVCLFARVFACVVVVLVVGCL